MHMNVENMPSDRAPQFPYLHYAYALNIVNAVKEGLKRTAIVL